jgi:Kef-type K+ transport system membrane component KefB
VLAAIVEELPTRWSPVGERALRTAVLADGVVWTSLVALGIAFGATSSTPALYALSGGALLAGAVLAGKLVGRTATSGPLIVPTVVLCSIAGALGTDLLGLHYSIGAAVAGFAARPRPSVTQAFTQLKPIVYAVFLPIFLVSATAHAPLQSIAVNSDATMALGWCLVAALVAKVLPALSSAALRRMGRGEAVMYAALLNCRGVTELVVAAIGLEMGLINGVGFAILSVVALTSTLLTSPAIGMVDRRTPARCAPGSGTTKANESSPSTEGVTDLI